MRPKFTDQRKWAQSIVDILNMKPIRSIEELEKLGEEYDQPIRVNQDADADQEPDLASLSPTREQELRRYVDSWLESGYRLGRWARKQEFQAELNRRQFSLHGKTPHLHASWGHESEGPAGPDGLTLFLGLITGPFFNAIKRCPKCGRYLLDTTPTRKRRFCSGGKCGHHFYAVKSKNTGRKAERQKVIAELQEWLDDFPRKSPARQAAELQGCKNNWKRLAERAVPGATSRFITLAEHKKELKIPSILQSKRN